MIDIQRKFIFIHIPKTGGSSVTYALFPKLRGKWGKYKGHFLPNEYEPVLWKHYFTFCFIRNPWDRMVSLYHYHCDGVYLVNNADIEFKEFCLSFPKYVKHGYHKLKQIDYLYLGKEKIDFMGKFENLEQDFQNICQRLNIIRSLPHLIKSERQKDYRLYYDRETKDFVYNYFYEDIQLGNYQFDE